MTDADQLESLTKSIVRSEERRVDVEADLRAIRARVDQRPAATRMVQRRRLVAAAVAVLLVAGFAGVVLVLDRGEADPSVTAPSSGSITAVTASPSLLPTSPPTTTTANLPTASAVPSTTISTTTSQAASSVDAPLVTLQANGLNDIEFGTDTETAIAALTDLLGTPDDDTGWIDPVETGEQVLGFCGSVGQRSLRWDNLSAGFIDGELEGLAGFVAYGYSGVVWNGTAFQPVETPMPAAATADGLTLFQSIESAQSLYGPSFSVGTAPEFPAASLDLGGPRPLTLWLDDDLDTIERIESNPCG